MEHQLEGASISNAVMLDAAVTGSTENDLCHWVIAAQRTPT